MTLEANYHPRIPEPDEKMKEKVIAWQLIQKLEAKLEALDEKCG